MRLVLDWDGTVTERDTLELEPCKRSSLPQGDVAYAGDGYSDRCAAFGATQVFATGALAEWLHGRDVSFERFENLYDVLAVLDAGRT